MENNKLQQIFSGYSATQIGVALFCLSLWPNNVSAQIKILILYNVFLSMKENTFKGIDEKLKYKDFGILFSKITDILPDLPQFEDYCPVNEWGEVKTYYNDKWYRILYGCEIELPYDWVEVFKVLHSRHFETTEPLKNLEESFIFLDALVNNISGKKNISKNVANGNFEIPDKDFFSECNQFLENVSVFPTIHSDLYCKIGEHRIADIQTLINQVFDGEFLLKNFLNIEGTIIPIHPRKHLINLIDFWGKEKKNNFEEDFKHRIHNVCAYAKVRFPEKRFIHLSNALIDENHHELIYSFGIFSGENLLLFYDINSILSLGDDYEKSAEMSEIIIQDINCKVKESIDVILKNGEIIDNIKEGILKFHHISSVIPIGIVDTYTTTQKYMIAMKNDFLGDIIPLSDVLCILDDCWDIKLLYEFFHFRCNSRNSIIAPGSSVTDSYFWYKNNYGIYTEGAEDPNMMVIHGSVGSESRYDSLVSFQKKIPTVGKIYEPGMRRIEQSGNETILIERSRPTYPTGFIQIGKGGIILRSPDIGDFEGAEKVISVYQQLLVCLSYYLRQTSFLKTYEYLLDGGIIQYHIVSDEHILNDKSLKQFSHLLSSHQYISTDYNNLDSNWYAVRLVINQEKCIQEFSKSSNDAEIDYTIEAIKGLSGLLHISQLETVKQEVEKFRGRKPGFKMHPLELEYSFPQFYNTVIPDDKHYSVARKEVAKIIKKLGYTEGQYNLEKGKKLINEIRKEFIECIDKTISEYNLKELVPKLISNLDGLFHDNYMEFLQLKVSDECHIEYEPVGKYTEKSNEYLGNILNYRFLLEKSIQLQPSGTEEFSDDKLKTLLGFADWVDIIQKTSDGIHYDIYAGGIEVKRDFSFELFFDNTDPGKDSYDYMYEKNAIQSGKKGNLELKYVDDDSIIQTTMGTLNTSFMCDIGVTFDQISKFFMCMMYWEITVGDEKIETYQHACINDIFRGINKNEKWISKNEIEKILDFFELKHLEVTSILLDNGDIENVGDIPIREHNKRFSRYIIRPFMKVEGDYYWGKVTLYRVWQYWVDSMLSGIMPSRYALPKTTETVEQYKHDYLDKNFVEHIYQILNNKFQCVKEFEFIKRETSGKSHDNVGDYDVLCYDDKNKTLRLIECKNLTPKYCMKDINTMHQDIFGKNRGKIGKKSFIGKVIKREDYMSKHINDLNRLLNRKLDDKNSLKIKSIFLTPQIFRPTRKVFSQGNSDILYLTPETLMEYIGK